MPTWRWRSVLGLELTQTMKPHGKNGPHWRAKTSQTDTQMTEAQSEIAGRCPTNKTNDIEIEMWCDVLELMRKTECCLCL